MTGVEVILAALAAGEGGGQVLQAAVVDAWTGLRERLRGRPAGRERAQEVLESEVTDPEMWRAGLGEDLVDCGGDRDEQALAIAHCLLALMDRDEVRVGRYAVMVSGVDGVQVGDGVMYMDTAYGPTAGVVSGPVTVNYGGLAVPPTLPGA